MMLSLLRKTIVVALLLILVGPGITAARATEVHTIAVIGTGRVAAALGPQFAKLDHRIIYGSRDPARESVQALVTRTHKTAAAMLPHEAAAEANIIVLATPWTATEGVVKALGDLAGKIIIDPTNAYAKAADGLRELGVATSAAELIQSWAPEAHVVKAFNTLNSVTMADPDTANGPVTIPIVGDNPAAKDQVAALITGIGLEVTDLGPLRYARVVENMLIVWMNARIMGNPFHYHLRPQQAD